MHLKNYLLLLLFTITIPCAAQNLKSYDQTVPGTTLKFKMVAIPAGSFMMGSPASQKHRDADEGPQKKVQLSPFWLAEHEVTFDEWDAFFKSMDIPQTKNISVDAVSRPTAQYIDLTWGMGRNSKNPTNSMSQQAALMYCKWLYEKTGIFYRLPTEAEWEYACKAGQDNFGTDPKSLKEYGYFKDNSDGKYHVVKALKPNAWGLFDMLGNLSEWTLDQYDAATLQKLTESAKDPVLLPVSKYPRVVKGGSYLNDAKELRCSNKIPSDPSWNIRDPQVPKSRWWLTDGMGVGFRLARPAAQPSSEDIQKFFAQCLK